MPTIILKNLDKFIFSFILSLGKINGKSIGIILRFKPTETDYISY